MKKRFKKTSIFLRNDIKKQFGLRIGRILNRFLFLQESHAVVPAFHKMSPPLPKAATFLIKHIFLLYTLMLQRNSMRIADSYR